MSETENPLEAIGKLSKVAEALVNKVSGAVGALYEPFGIERKAKAEGKAEIIKAKAEVKANLIRAEGKLKITEVEERGLRRLVHEEGKKQENIESITAKAIPELQSQAKPEELEDDWLTAFFDKSKLVSDDEMQMLWAKILAGEANQSGSFSRRTLDIVSCLDSNTAQLFSKLSDYIWFAGADTPLIYSFTDKVYERNGLNLKAFLRFQSLGLITLAINANFTSIYNVSKVRVTYHSQSACLNLEKCKNILDIGQVDLTPYGREILSLCESNYCSEFYRYVVEKWSKDGILQER